MSSSDSKQLNPLGTATSRN